MGLHYFHFFGSDLLDLARKKLTLHSSPLMLRAFLCLWLKEVVLVRQWLCGYCWAVIANTRFLLFSSLCCSSHPPVSRLDLCKKLGGDPRRHLTWTEQRDVPCGAVLCSAIKPGVEEEEDEGFFSFMLAISWRLLLWEIVSHCLFIT